MTSMYFRTRPHFDWPQAIAMACVWLCVVHGICYAAPSADSPDSAALDAPWWSLKALTRPSVPSPPDGKSRTWPRTAIDNFILAKLAEKGLHPSSPADKRTLLRRVYFDLIGLPPTPEQMANFLSGNSSDAYEK